MSGRDRLRVALAAGLVALGPVVNAQAPATTVAAARGEAVAVSVGRQENLTRINFRWRGGAQLVARQDGAVLELRFSRAGEPDLAPLRSFPPPFVKSVARVSEDGAPLVLRLELEPRTTFRTFQEGDSVVVDLSRPQPLRQQATADGRPSDPAPRSGIVPVTIEEVDGGAVIEMRWGSQARAAAFRRGEAIYLVFDSAAAFDTSKALRASRWFSDLSVVRGEGVVGLRLASPADVQVSAESEGALWRFRIGPQVEPGATAPLRQSPVSASASRLAVDFGRPGVVRWLEDPEVGDRFAAALLEGPVVGFEQKRVTLEAALLPAAHGAVIEARADGVGAGFEGGELVVSRGLGLVTGQPPAEALDSQGAVGLEGALAAAALREEIERLQRRAAVELGQLGGEPSAHLELARLLIANELAYEALGVLGAALAIDPGQETSPQFRLLRGAANAMVYRFGEAREDLDYSGLAADAGASLWRGYVAAQTEQWAQARRDLERGRAALFSQPAAVRVRMGLALARSALELGDLAASEQALGAVQGESLDAAVRDEARLLEGRLALAHGDYEAALEVFDALASESRAEAVVVQAKLQSIRVRRQIGQTPPDAVETLESLRFRWRGDALELETVATLGYVYADLGRWREALAVMQAASARYPRAIHSRVLRQDLAALFERLFLEGEADALAPIQALALFYEFRDLTPVGVRGDLMIRRLAQRLVSLDLLEQAANLLQHQVDNRLRGILKSQVALELASVYLLDGKPERALRALDSSRQPNLPPELAASRRIAEASALIGLERYDHAKELVERMQTPEAARIRAEAAWRQRDWPMAASALREVLPPPPRGAASLEEDQRAIILRLAVVSVFAEDETATAALRRDFAGAMAASPDSEAFDVLTLKPSVTDVRVRNVAREVARIDLLERFLNRVTSPSASTPA